jgi:hypothetical protein
VVDKLSILYYFIFPNPLTYKHGGGAIVSTGYVTLRAVVNRMLDRKAPNI